MRRWFGIYRALRTGLAGKTAGRPDLDRARLELALERITPSNAPRWK